MTHKEAGRYIHIFMLLITPLLLAQSIHAKELNFLSTNKKNPGFGFVGGSSCCDCRTEYYGTLPKEFHHGYSIRTITFYLNNSLKKSHYSKQLVGPTRLTLILDGHIKTSATTQRTPLLAKHPVKTPWLVKFQLKLPVPVRPGMRWKLIDGDNNIYSAAILHASNKIKKGLPGTHRTLGCRYERTEPAWFSASFKLGGHPIDSEGKFILDEQKLAPERISAPDIPTDVWSVEFADPMISSGFRGRRYFRYAANNLAHRMSPTIAGITFDRVVHGFVSRSPKGPWSRRFEVYVPRKASKGVQDSAIKIIRLLLHWYWYGIEYLDQQPFHKKPVTRVWLHPKLPEGVFAPIATQINENLVFWGITTWIKKAPSIELLRTVTHEYSHMVVKGAGKYDTNNAEGEYGATETWANGYLGERLLVRWLRRNLEHSSSSRVNEWDNKDEVWDKNGIHAWEDYYYIDMPVQILLEGDASDAQIMKYWWENKDKVVNSARLPGFYAYIGACLWIDEIHGPAVLKETLRWTPQEFQKALLPLLE